MGFILLKNANIITPYEEKNKQSLIIEDDLINSIINQNDIISENKLEDINVYDLEGKYIVPGFIDIHTHGGKGVDCLEGNLEKWIDYNFKCGVTSFLPTVITMPLKDINCCIENIYNNINKNNDLSGIIGINLEGPYINPSYGAQLAEYCIKPIENDYKNFIKKSKNYLKIMTIAPEIEGSDKLSKELVKNNIIVSIGHTNASQEETEMAIKLGVKSATHIFNAFGYQKGIWEEKRKNKVCGVREAKALEILLARDDIYTEVICDKNAWHVNKTLLKILMKCKPLDKIILITDNMNSAGLPPGNYNLPDGRVYEIHKNDDIAYLDGGVYGCGSILKLNNAAKNLIKHTGIDFIDSIKTITINPAKLLKLDNIIGSIEVGKKANISVIDRDFNVYITIANGKVVYIKNNLFKEK